MAPHTGRLRLIGIGVRIVTRAAPQPIARSALTGARRQLLHVAGHLHVRPICIPHQVRRVVRQPLARLELRKPVPGPLHARFTGEMALAADRVAAIWFKPRGIDHLRPARILHVLAARTVAALARHSIVEKWRVSVAILAAEHRTHAARMTQKASRLDRARELNPRIFLEPRRRVPNLLARIPGDGNLEQIPFTPGKKRPSGRIRSDEVIHGLRSAVEGQSITFYPVSVSGCGEACRRTGPTRPLDRAIGVCA